MARTALTRTVAANNAGGTLAMDAADAAASPNGNYTPFTGRERIICLNSDSSTHTVTVKSKGTQSGLTLGDLASGNIAAGAIWAAGPFDDALFNNAGQLWINADSTLVKIGVEVLTR